MDSANESIIPGLHDDLALRCLAKLSHGYHGLLETVSKRWRDTIRSPEYAIYKAREGWCGDWLFVLADDSKNRWVAYDPEADRWHQLPKVSKNDDEFKHYGFSCVAVCKQFLVIGGCYAALTPAYSHQRPMVTNDVFQFDPFKKQWTPLASMQTPRSHFACSVVSGKVYVAGGRNLSYPGGIPHAEVYDPVTNKWEDLPPMPNPLMDCLGLSYKGKLCVLSDQVGLPDQETSEVYDPSTGKWCTVEDTWPFSRAMQVAVQVLGNDQVYTVVDLGESLIKKRDPESGGWYDIGTVPPIQLRCHSRTLEVFGYGFAALRDELFIIGGKVLRWENSGTGSFDVVKLNLVRACDPSVLPLKWREIRPMCPPAGGSILGCASIEERPT